MKENKQRRNTTEHKDMILKGEKTATRRIWKEGYKTLGEFRDIWIKINGQWDTDLTADVIEFEVVR